jgi:hypothetical protein
MLNLSIFSVNAKILKIVFKPIEYEIGFERISLDKEEGQNSLFVRNFGLFCFSLNLLAGGGGDHQT